MTITVQTEIARRLSSWLRIEPNYLYMVQSVGIANNQAVSPVIDLGVSALVAIITPAVLTNASLRFQASDDGSTFYPLLDPSTNTRVTWTVATNVANWYYANPSIFWGIRYLKLDMSGNEGAARTFKVISRPS